MQKYKRSILFAAVSSFLPGFFFILYSDYPFNGFAKDGYKVLLVCFIILIVQNIPLFMFFKNTLYSKYALVIVINYFVSAGLYSYITHHNIFSPIFYYWIIFFSLSSLVTLSIEILMIRRRRLQI